MISLRERRISLNPTYLLERRSITENTCIGLDEHNEHEPFSTLECRDAVYKLTVDSGNVASYKPSNTELVAMDIRTLDKHKISHFDRKISGWSYKN